MAYRNDTGDPYVEPESGVLKNLAGIGDSDRLGAFEGEMSILRQIELSENPLNGPFDVARLKAIRRHLFQDVYAWAGEPRTIDKAKGNSRFGSHLHVESYPAKLFDRLAVEREQWCNFAWNCRLGGPARRIPRRNQRRSSLPRRERPDPTAIHRPARGSAWLRNPLGPDAYAGNGRGIHSSVRGERRTAEIPDPEAPDREEVGSRPEPELGGDFLAVMQAFCRIGSARPDLVTSSSIPAP